MKEPTVPNVRLVPWVVTCALFMENLDSTILTTAIPTIARDFGVGPLELKFALTAYLISLAIFIPASGWVAQSFGFRRVFSLALITFVGGSALCGLSQSLGQLVVARMVQGVGGAMMVPTARFLLMRTYPKEQLVRITNLVTIPALVGPALGPLLGGALTTYTHWRLIFLINIPVGLLGLYAARRALPKDRGQATTRFDGVGFILCALGLGGLSFNLETLGEPMVGVQAEAMVAAMASAALIAYGMHAHGHPSPFLRLSLFRVPTFRLGMLGSMASRLGVAGVPFLLPLLYQTCLGYSPLHAGLITLPLSVGMLLMRLAVTRLLRRLGFRTLLITNTVLLALAIAHFAWVDIDTPLWHKLFASFIYGALASVQFSCMNVLAYVDLEPGHLGDATSIFSTVQQFAMGLGVSLSGLCVKYLWHARGLSMQAAFSQTFLILAGLAVASTAIFALLKPNAGGVVSGHRGRMRAPLP